MRGMQALLVGRKKTDSDKVRRRDLARATAVAAETGAVLAKLRNDVATVRVRNGSAAGGERVSYRDLTPSFIINHL